MEEDKGQRIVDQGREVKRKILTGKSKGSKGCKEYLFNLWYIKVKKIEMIYILHVF